MKSIGKVLLVLLITLLASGSTLPKSTVAVDEQEQQHSITLQGTALDAKLHEVYEGAWLRASKYTSLQDNEMPKFPEETVYWTMSKETWPVDHDIDTIYWTTDMFETGITRVFAWYKTDGGLRVEHGVSLPINARIEMQVMPAEILQYEHYVEGILVHEMIHYIHHMRVMNQKGWVTIWPGDGHNYMAYLKYVKGYDLPANK
jgi:hypothetical protein